MFISQNSDTLDICKDKIDGFYETKSAKLSRFKI